YLQHCGRAVVDGNLFVWRVFVWQYSDCAREFRDCGGCHRSCFADPDACGVYQGAQGKPAGGFSIKNRYEWIIAGDCMVLLGNCFFDTLYGGVLTELELSANTENGFDMRFGAAVFAIPFYPDSCRLRASFGRIAPAACFPRYKTDVATCRIVVHHVAFAAVYPTQ